AALVVDDDLLAELLRQLRRHGSGRHIGGAAGREGHDHGDRLVRVLRHRRLQAGQRRKRERHHTTQRFHSHWLTPPFPVRASLSMSFTPTEKGAVPKNDPFPDLRPESVVKGDTLVDIWPVVARVSTQLGLTR